MKYIVIYSFLFSSVSFAKLTQVENDHLKKAIAENDISKFKAVLQKADSPFKAGVLSSSTEEVMSGYDLIKLASSNKDCRDEFVEALIQAGAKPYPDYYLGTTSASEQLCPKTIEALLPFYDDKTQANFGSSVVKNTGERVKKFASGQSITEQQLKNGFESVGLFKEKIKSNCKEYDVNNNWCLLKDSIAGLQKTLETETAKSEAKDKAEEFANSPEGLQERYCELQADIQEAQAAIDRQNEIGKTSGVVDKSVLHSKGARIVDLKIEMKNLKIAYKNKFKNNFKEKCF